VNLTRVASRGRALLESALDTSSTTVAIRRDADDLDATVDFDTLAIADTSPAARVAPKVSALITSMGPEARTVGRDRDEPTPTHNVWLPVTVVNVQDGDLLDVTAKLDALLDGATLLVTAVLDDGVGVGRHLHARRV
jgi:hypothetical protein